MEKTTYVVQCCKAEGAEIRWTDACGFDSEEEARLQEEAYKANLGAVLGPFRIVRRTETVI